MNPAVRGDTPDLDRVLAAVGLYAEWQQAAGRLILDSLGIGLTNDLDARMEHLAEQQREYDELTMRSRWCADDPRGYLDGPFCDEVPRIPLGDWADSVCNELDADAAQILADLRVGAEAIAALADRTVVAA